MIEMIFGDLWPVIVGIVLMVGVYYWIVDLLSGEDKQVKKDAECPHCKQPLVLRVGKGKGGQ